MFDVLNLFMRTKFFKLKENEEIGKDINDVIGNTDVVLDVAITANRPDCNSILGVAR